MGKKSRKELLSEIKAQFRRFGLPARNVSEVWQPCPAALLRPEKQDYDLNMRSKYTIISGKKTFLGRNFVPQHPRRPHLSVGF